MNNITDPDKLRTLCEKSDEFGQQVKLYWYSDLTISPSPSFKNDAEVEADGEELLSMIGQRIGVGESSILRVGEIEDWGGN